MSEKKKTTTQTLSQNDRQWIAWLIAVVLIVAGTLIGVQFPQLPPTPGGDTIEAQAHPGQYSNFTGLVVAGPTTFATATPAVIVNSDGLGKILDIQDGGTPIASYANGGAYSSSGAATLSGAQTINNYVAVTAPTAVATGVPGLTVTNNGLGLVARFLDAAQELLGIRDGGGVVVSAPTAIATTQPALVVDTSGGQSNVFEVRSAATPVWYIAPSGSYVASGNMWSTGRIEQNDVMKVAVPTNVATATPGVVIDSAAVSAILEVRDASTPVAQFRNGGTLDLIANPIEQDIGTENLGVLPSVATCSITYTAAAGGTGACATIANGEVWLVHGALINITTNFDVTGDDATLVLGDGNDDDGFCVLADANMQTTDVGGPTGTTAGWQCIEVATRGVYLDEAATNSYTGGILYAPSGSAETIDYILDESSGETYTAGAATIYIFYTRLQ